MEPLLPSEIARLILGYLEDQQCTEAAKQFLESSPHLQECRTVFSHGKRFSTKVNGLTLMDIIEKFSAISNMIQERLSKATDCEQLKHCGDLIEQLKFLVEEPRGQRFVVNINVPSQSNTQTSNGSPIIANNMRRRRHSNSERNKRSSKPQSSTMQQPDVLLTSPISHNIDTTPLESLPGNVNTFKQTESVGDKSDNRDDNVTHESSGQYDFEKGDEMWNTQQFKVDIDGKRKEEVNIATSTPSLKRCTAATNTEELLSFSSTEVQTNPYEIPESESESNDEPIENLSILTKEILNRTELQECIAENINRAIIPTDLSMRDECFNESIGGEGNTSIMAELNNAIKSIVEATETDPVFEKFLDEIIGPHTETDTSPEEDGEGKHSPKFLNELEEKHVDAAFGNISSPEPTIADTRASTENNAADVPLKHRLRSSSRQQNNRTEDETEKMRDQEKEQNTLEDQNAAAVLCIVNANIINNTSSEKKTLDDAKESTVTSEVMERAEIIMPATTSKEDTATKPLMSMNIQKIANNIAPSTSSNVESKVRKSTVKRPRPTRPKRDQAINDNQVVTKEEILTTPTLVVCSKEEVGNLLNMSHSSTIKSTSTSRFIPIAPKDSNKIAGPMETMYLRTVNLAQKLPVTRSLPTVVEEPSNSAASQVLLQSQRKTAKMNKTVSKAVHKIDATLTPIISADQRLSNSTEPVQMINKIAGGESQVITLYGDESSAKTSLDGANMPTINLEENISLSESGLSPYLKFSCSKTSQSHNLSDIDLTSVMESAKCITTATVTINASTADQQPSVSTSTDIISKRTPKSLLKSRSKNRRLSLSTPRKRSSHIRALDFNTPPKVINSARKANANESTAQFSSATTKCLKSVCRTSLFKSPPFSGSSATTVQKQPSPVKVCQSYKIPIATRSPAPKLMGGWDKFNGVGVIIGDVSSHGSTSASSSSEDRVQHKTSKAPAESWDADLRKSIQQSSKKEETEVKKPMKRRYSSNKDENSVTPKRSRYNQQSTKNRDKKKNCETQETQEMESMHEPAEHSQESTTGKNHDIVNACETSMSKSDRVPKSDDAPEMSTKTDGANVSGNNTVTAEKKPVKKYVQLKTIRTNLKKPDSDEGKKNTEDAGKTTNSSQMSDLTRILSTSNTQRILRMPDMIDPQTPRRFNNDGTSVPPPTPRMLSPGNNAVTPFIKLSDDSGKLRNSFISTPEFPITPGITLTPKHGAEETTRDVVKKNEYSSPYYEPSCEQAGGENGGMSKFKSIPTVNLESPVISSSHMKSHAAALDNLAGGDASYQACASTTKLEITQFEVIKENLPKEEAIKELKIASNSTKDSTASELNSITSSASVVAVQERHMSLMRINELPSGERQHEAAIVDDNYVAESDSSSSDISSSSNSSSSSSTSTTDSSSSCSSTGKSSQSPTKSATPHEDVGVVAGPVRNDEDNPDVDPEINEESSPKKVFAIEKTDEQLQATSQETPAKDESLLNEADISETPSSSKSGIENLTNLSTKISAIITEDEKLSRLSKSPKNSDNKVTSRARAKPKVTNVQYIQPGSSITVIKELVKSADSESDLHESTSSTHNKQLIMQLEEKRQRMIAKFRDAPKSNLTGGTTRKRILMNKATNNARAKSAQFNKINVRQTAKRPQPESHHQEEKRTSKPKQFASHVDKTKDKVDQVKRDLFSDEENDQRASKEKIKKRTEETQQSLTSAKEVLSISQEKAENPKEELSSVLQCLQLVPAHKNESEQQGQNGKQQQQLDEDRRGPKDVNEDNNSEINALTGSVDHYKHEYHFIYDDSAPVRKRRRRYSCHDLQIEINYADLSDPNPEESIKVMKATEFKEIFNLPPKNSKKRALGKKTPHKGEKAGDTLVTRTENETFNEKKSCTTDPQTLLNNVDLNKFLATVHGPE